ncbi:dihydroorotate dehydrogenase-like protein [uncultured Proteiniphilum sp.]|uniref:dihydroorotate dehydrogenase-like protein n=1 Tax=uncultured Proteiniphilum sp. TaxID=497637 RepID=UPI002639CB37|nr:dihydroorotate dehydrogenase-like protein [uncultured Proteiniphilum sp.]
MSDLSINYAKLKLKNPIIIGSSGLTDSVDKNKVWDRAGCGAIVLKSLFEEQIENESKTILKKYESPGNHDLIWNYVKGNKVMDYLNLIRGSKNYCSIPIIASINCYSDGSWIEFASQIESAGADALELNISAIVSDPAVHPMESSEKYINILKRIKDIISIPTIVKSSRLFNNIPWLVNQLKNNGADAVVLFNKLYQPDINIDTLKIISGSVFSSPQDLSETLRWLFLTSSNVTEIDLAASTGVNNWKDVIKCLLAGATAVQMVSALYQDKERKLIPEIIHRIEEWMDSRGFKSINDFKGKLNVEPAADKTVFERAQFMRYFSNHT